MHPFSIDYITRESEMKHDSLVGSMSPENDRTRQTPSPSDSGMGSDNNSPYTTSDEQKHTNERDSVAEALLALDKKAGATSAPEVNGSKPSHSYIALISMAILSTREKRILLCDIYQYIMDNFNYYNNGDKAWRNSIRHNLSLNECFIKNGRADNGKGNYWSIHPACIRDFSKGDFRRRQARRRARKSVREPSAGTNFGIPYRGNVGYVPMTASHISYHPYGTPSPSFYYPQSVASLPSSTHAPCTTSSSVLLSSSPVTSSLYSTGSSSSSPGLYSSNTGSMQTPSAAFSTLSAAAVQHYFADETRVAIAAQALAPQHLQPHLQFPNW